MSVGDESTPLGSEDRRVLEFASSHRLVSVRQVQRLLETTPTESDHHLARLVADGVLARERMGIDESPWFRVTDAGLREVARRLAPPGFDPRVRHSLGVASLSLMATVGVFGAVDRVITEQEMELLDRSNGLGAPFSALPGEFGGERGPHYPDLMVLIGEHRVAVELLLVASAPQVLDPVLRAYASDARMSAVLYLVTDPWAGRLVQSVAASLELSPMVHVQSAIATGI